MKHPISALMGILIGGINILAIWAHVADGKPLTPPAAISVTILALLYIWEVIE